MSTGSSGNFDDKFARVAALRPARKKASNSSPTPGTVASPSDGGHLASLLGATVQSNHFGEHLVIRRWFPTPEPCLTENDHRAARALRLLLPEERNGAKRASAKSSVKKNHHDNAGLAADPSQWLFLDTETTGLAGGSGTYAFLVGLAWWDGGGLQVEQFFMRDFSEEHSLLLALDERLAERRVLVTFNGKSFDWPLLETRFRMTRAIAPRFPAAHLDLLHPARQLWRPRLGSVRLAELEKHVLQTSAGSRLDWTRDFDVDSSMIPEIYFNFVRGGYAEPLVPIFHHNQMDLRGLAALAERIFEMLGGGLFSGPAKMGAPATDLDQSASVGNTSTEPLDLYGLSRLLERRGDPVRARKICHAAVSAGLPVEHDFAARRDLARLAKRAGDLPNALELWEGLLSPKPNSFGKIHSLAPEQSLTLERILLRGSSGSHAFFAQGGQLRAALEACEQLAIHFEHRVRSLSRATQLTQHGLHLLRRAQGARTRDDKSVGAAFCRKWESRLARRLTRLENKAARSAPLKIS
ncbi:MAG TPA: ribonuclease H-like domain-containing protein [Candidatus Limnocylindrales bacterium]|nr:ribonuclease H-like domain-containing protein [Candidatus Limnocylindrales bacterium]